MTQSENWTSRNRNHDMSIRIIRMSFSWFTDITKVSNILSSSEVDLLPVFEFGKYRGGCSMRGVNLNFLINNKR